MVKIFAPLSQRKQGAAPEKTSERKDKVWKMRVPISRA
jgi:hypothetical protein